MDYKGSHPNINLATMDKTSQWPELAEKLKQYGENNTWNFFFF